MGASLPALEGWGPGLGVEVSKTVAPGRALGFRYENLFLATTSAWADTPGPWGFRGTQALLASGEVGRTRGSVQPFLGLVGGAVFTFALSGDDEDALWGDIFLPPALGARSGLDLGPFRLAVSALGVLPPRWSEPHVGRSYAALEVSVGG